MKGTVGYKDNMLTGTVGYKDNILDSLQTEYRNERAK